MITSRSFNSLFPKLVSKIINQGKKVKGGNTIEIFPIGFQIINPLPSLLLYKSLNLNYPSLIMKRLQMLYGTADIEALCYYDPLIKSKLDAVTGLFNGAYGPRIKSQMKYVYYILKRDPASRRGVIVIYYHSDQNKKRTFDVPSTICLQFLLRENRLNLICFMRSNDFWKGLPYDVSLFCFLQEVMARWLNVKPGTFTHLVGSAHIYIKDIPAAKKFLISSKEKLQIQYMEFNLEYKFTFINLRNFLMKEKLFRSKRQKEHKIIFKNPYFQWCWDLLYMR